MEMAQRLKRWESPRREGRNTKGRGGSARQRQLYKQQQVLRQKLKADDKNQTEREEQNSLFPSFLPVWYRMPTVSLIFCDNLSVMRFAKNYQ
jgi:hypothetical protein